MVEQQIVGRPVGGGHYDKRFIAQMVEEVMKGKSIRCVCEEYGIKRSTLRNWLQDNSLPVTGNFVKRAVTSEVKRSIALRVLTGQLSVREAQLSCGVKAVKTIEVWVRQTKLENPELVELTQQSMKKGKAAKKSTYTDQSSELKALQKALEEAQLKVTALNTLIDVAEEQLQINIRKKPGAKQSND